MFGIPLIWKFLVSLIVDISSKVIEYFIEKKTGPNTIETNEIPNDIKHDWNAYVDDQLRDKGGNTRQPKKLSKTGTRRKGARLHIQRKK